MLLENSKKLQAKEGLWQWSKEEVIFGKSV